MLWAIALILGAMWALAMFSSQTFGGFVHILVIVAVIVVAFQMIKNRQKDQVV